MEIQVDVLQAALARAVSDSVSKEMQGQIFEKALLDYLFRAERGGQTRLHDAFQRALNESAQGMAARLFAAEPWRTKLEDAVRGAIEDALPSIREKLAKKLADGIRYW